MATKTRSTAQAPSEAAHIPVRVNVRSATRAEESALLATPEFQHLPLSSIVIGQQIRSKIDTESDSFKALQESIHAKGIVQPVVVAGPAEGKYNLICGERRCLAAQRLGFETVPCRLLDPIAQKAEIISLQLIENLQREDLNPIDLANGILSLFQARHPENQFDVDGVLAVLVSYMRSPDYLSQEVSNTVLETSRIVGTSLMTVHRTLSLLKLGTLIQEAISAGNLPVSQGYLFASHLDCPDSEKVFNSVMKTPVTNATLEKMLTTWQNVKPDEEPPAEITLARQHRSVGMMQTTIMKNTGKYGKDDLQQLAEELRTLLDAVQSQLAVVSGGLGA